MTFFCHPGTSYLPVHEKYDIVKEKVHKKEENVKYNRLTAISLITLIAIHSVFYPSLPVFASEFEDNGNNVTSENAESSVTYDKPYREQEFNLEIVTLEDWKKTAIGEYPISVDSDEWKKMAYSEAKAACDMPDEYAKSLTTDELAVYLINYPFLSKIQAFDDLSVAMKTITGESGVFKEFFLRENYIDVLTDTYASLGTSAESNPKLKNISKDDLKKKAFIDVYMGLNFDLLSDKQAERFVEEFEKYFLNEKMNEKFSSYSQLFYAAIKTKLGYVPDNAYSEQNSFRYDDNGEPAEFAGSASITTFNCAVCGARLRQALLFFNGNIVSCYEWVSGGYDSSDIADIDNEMGSLYPTYTKLNSASSKYNCHSYAWYMASASNVYWIDDPASIYNDSDSWILWHIPMRALCSGDRVTFWANGELLHSAIAENSTYCISKLGHGGVYRATISEILDFYDATEVISYIPG